MDCLPKPEFVCSFWDMDVDESDFAKFIARCKFSFKSWFELCHLHTQLGALWFLRDTLIQERVLGVGITSAHYLPLLARINLNSHLKDMEDIEFIVDIEDRSYCGVCEHKNKCVFVHVGHGRGCSRWTSTECKGLATRPLWSAACSSPSRTWLSNRYQKCENCRVEVSTSSIKLFACVTGSNTGQRTTTVLLVSCAFQLKTMLLIVTIIS